MDHNILICLRIDENGTRIDSKPLNWCWFSTNLNINMVLFPDGKQVINGSIPDNRSVLKFSFNTTSVSDKGHLDMIEIEYLQNMKASLTNQSLIFFSDEVDGVIRYNGNVFSNSSFLVFNITDYASPKKVDVEYSGSEFYF